VTPVKSSAPVIGRVTGPHITRYELRLAPGTQVGTVAHLKDDLAYALAATDIRILAPIPGKQAVGVEVPNARRRIVHLGDVYSEPPPDWSPLTVWLGKDISGKAVPADLAKMPHVLVAGTTGLGFRDTNAWLAALTGNVLPPTFYYGDQFGSFNSWARWTTGFLFSLTTVFALFPIIDGSMQGTARDAERQLARVMAHEGR